MLAYLTTRMRPNVPVIFLDNGYHFVESIDTQDTVESVYDIRVLNITPELTPDQQDQLLDKNFFVHDPSECCRLSKVVPLGETLHGYSAWVTGLRRVEAPIRANPPLISFGKASKLVKVNWRCGPTKVCRITSPSSTCWSIRLYTKTIRRSDASLTRSRLPTSPTRTVDAGKG